MKKFLKDIHTALDACKPPFCFGTFEPKADRDLLLYYNDESDKSILGRIDFEDVTDSDLKRLADACRPATFGRDDVDILDPTYRKALKLNNTDFAIGFDIYSESGILKTIKYALLEGQKAQTNLRVELYKLNIYDQEGFFKPHKDTPRSEKMIGSLVLVYPTSHEGGALALRHGGKEWVFDSGKVLSNTVQPSIAYVAFFSDVEHEVLPVQKGYRVTITYNLYVDDDDDDDDDIFISSEQTSISSTSNHVSSLKATIRAHLKKEKFLPKGGILAFHLYHEYPVAKEGVSAISETRLKGRDAIMYAAFEELGLNTRTTFLYQSPEGPLVQVLCDHLNLDEEMYDCSDFFIEAAREQGQVVRNDGTDRDGEMSGHGRKPFIWSNPKTNTLNRVEESYIAYGNEAQMEYCYGWGVLVVDVGEPGNRKLNVSGRRDHSSSSD